MSLVGPLLIGAVRLCVGASPRWVGSVPTLAQRIYFANHTSHIDTLALWSALPPVLRRKTRPVAAADYWRADAIRRHVALEVLNAVLVDRSGKGAEQALIPLNEALAEGQSLIIFPEGTRGTDALPEPFKSGLFHLAQAWRDVELIPVYLENLHRAMPKGSFVPVPLICTVRFGAALARHRGEEKSAFLTRARTSVCELAA